MIKETYCNPEISKLLKEKNFDCLESKWYLVHEDGFNEPFDKKDKFCNPEDVWIKRPTQQVAIDWLRRKHKINIEIRYDFSNQKYIPWIKSTKDGRLIKQMKDIISSITADTYEKATEKSLLWVLNNLI